MPDLPTRQAGCFRPLSQVAQRAILQRSCGEWPSRDSNPELLAFEASPSADWGRGPSGFRRQWGATVGTLTSIRIWGAGVMSGCLWYAVGLAADNRVGRFFRSADGAGGENRASEVVLGYQYVPLTVTVIAHQRFPPFPSNGHSSPARRTLDRVFFSAR